MIQYVHYHGLITLEHILYCKYNDFGLIQTKTY